MRIRGYIQEVCFMTYYRTYLPGTVRSYVFHVKIKHFVTAKSDQDPDLQGSALVWLLGAGSGLSKSKKWIRKPMRIRNTAKKNKKPCKLWLEAWVHQTSLSFELLKGPMVNLNGIDTMWLRQPIGSKKAVLGIPDILVRIRICGSVRLTNGSG